MEILEPRERSLNVTSWPRARLVASPAARPASCREFPCRCHLRACSSLPSVLGFPGARLSLLAAALRPSRRACSSPLACSRFAPSATLTPPSSVSMSVSCLWIASRPAALVHLRFVPALPSPDLSRTTSGVCLFGMMRSLSVWRGCTLHRRRRLCFPRHASLVTAIIRSSVLRSTCPSHPGAPGTRCAQSLI